MCVSYSTRVQNGTRVYPCGPVAFVHKVSLVRPLVLIYNSMDYTPMECRGRADKSTELENYFCDIVLLISQKLQHLSK